MDMTMESCRKFVEVLASDAPAPGGGGAAALVGAIGTALGNMVGSLTLGKKKYAAVEEEINALKARSNYLLRRIKELNGQSVPSGIPHAVPVLKTEPSAPPCVAAGAIKGGEVCPS